MKKLDLQSIVKDDILIGQPVMRKVEFTHYGENYQTDVLIKPLSYHQSEPLFKRLGKIDEDKSLIAEWISTVVVDEKGKNYLSVEDVQQKFSQQLAMAIFNEILGIERLDDKKDDKGKSS